MLVIRGSLSLLSGEVTCTIITRMNRALCVSHILKIFYV